MSFHLPNGSQVFVESTTGAAIAASAISNASQAVFTLPTAHGLVVGDVIRVATAAWGSLVGMVFPVTAVSGTAVTVNFDTTNVNRFPAGNSAATVVKVTAWTEIPQITEVSSDGNEQQYLTVQFLADDRQRQIPTFKSGQTMTFTIAHDSALGFYSVLRKADDAGDTRAMYMYVPKGKENRYWSAVQSFNDVPTVALNELEVVSLACAVQSQRMTFAALP